MTHFLKSTVLAAGFAVLCAGHVLAYDGVLAPAPAQKDTPATNAPAAPSGGYSGVIAAPPSKDNKKEPPKGYSGVIPGVVEKAPAPVQAAKPNTSKPPVALPDAPKKDFAGKSTPRRQPQVTSPYKTTVERKTINAQDLKSLAALHSHDKNADGIPDKIAKDFRLPESMVPFLNIPRARTEGMLPMEKTIKDSIDFMMGQVKQGQQDPKENLKHLKSIRAGLLAQRGIPDSVYKVMGMPETYVNEEREGLDKALERIDIAIRELGG